MSDDFDDNWEKWRKNFKRDMKSILNEVDKMTADTKMVRNLSLTPKKPRLRRSLYAPRAPQMPAPNNLFNWETIQKISVPSMASATLNGKEYVVIGDNVTLSINNGKIIVNGKEYTDADFVDGLLDLRSETKAVPLTKDSKNEIHELQDKDYRGNDMVSYLKELEEENKRLKFDLAGDKRVEEEQTSNFLPLLAELFFAICLVALYLFFL